MGVSTAELDEFHRFAQEKRPTAGWGSLEESLRAWRVEQARLADLAEIRAGLADIEAGRVITLEEFAQEMRQLYKRPVGT